MKNEKLSEINPKTTYACFAFPKGYTISSGYLFIPEKKDGELMYGELMENGYFPLGKVISSDSSTEYTFRLDYRNKDLIDVDCTINGKRVPGRGFSGHHPDKSNEDERVFSVQIPNSESPIFSGDIKVVFKKVVAAFTDNIQVKDKVNIQLRKAGETEWKTMVDQ